MAAPESDPPFSEFLVGAFALASSFVSSLVWLQSNRLAGRCRCRSGVRLALAATPLLGAGLIVWTLCHWAAGAVLAESDTFVMLTMAGVGWMGIASLLFPLFGVSLRVHALERNNSAAIAAWCGGILGAALCYAGGEIGEGPEVWENVFCAALATFAMAAGWMVLDAGAGISRSATVDRDLASGIRAFGFLIAQALIAGRAVAGDWVSVSRTFADFGRDAWPMLPLALGAVWLERRRRPSSERPTGELINDGILPAAIFIGAAAAWVASLGAWKFSR